jgi:hypothetical protein
MHISLLKENSLRKCEPGFTVHRPIRCKCSINGDVSNDVSVTVDY